MAWGLYNNIRTIERLNFAFELLEILDISKTSQKLYLFGVAKLRAAKRSRFFLSCLFLFALTAILGAGFFFILFTNYSPFKSSCQKDCSGANQYLEESQNVGVLAFDLNIIQETALQALAPPFVVAGDVLGVVSDSNEDKEVQEYVVKEGDTVENIAKHFNISLETILWANDLKSTTKLKVGQKLAILPVSGVLHVVREGDTLSYLAQTYKANSRDIIEYNDIFDESKIYAGDFLIIPGGTMPKNFPQSVQVLLPGTYFICPVPSPCRITQGLHWYNAVDFGNGKCGEPVFAAAGGKVQRTGYGSISGYYVRVLHPNGVVTFYGHLSGINVAPGQKVYQGQVIGYVGYTGLTIPRGPAGCHLHFDVRFASNPFAKYGVGVELGKLPY